MLAAAARPVLPSGVSEIAVAIVLGLAVANLTPLESWLAPGARLAMRSILRVGIVLLGARLALDDVVRQGIEVVALVSATTTSVLVLGWIVARRRDTNLRLLVAAGTAICGNSAIVAIAPVLEADERDVAVAVATITGFGVLAVFAYPIVGASLGLPSEAFGLWAGTAINDTSQVVAAGYAYDAVAGDAAVVTKLTRTLLLVPAVVAFALLVLPARPESRPTTGGPTEAGPSGRTVRAARRGLPLFAIGFVLMAAARSVGLLDGSIAGRPAFELASAGASAAILVALAGVGLQTNVREVASVGFRPLAFGLLLSLALAVGSLATIVGLGLGGA